MISPQKSAVTVENLSFSYGANPILTDFSFSFEAGQLYAVIGPNGCGKTTLLRCLSGFLKPQNGSVSLDGTIDLQHISRKALAKRISFLPQLRSVPDISVEALVSHGRFPHLGLSRKLTAHDREIVQEAMRSAGILDFAGRPLPSLSGGERQRVYISMLLAQDTDIVLLDEPTTYLDSRHKFEILSLLRAMRDSGKTVITVLHDLPLALSGSDTVILLEKGRCAAGGTPDTLYTSSAIDRVFGISLRRVEAEGRTVYAEMPAPQA